jgi:hypothetical protein
MTGIPETGWLYTRGPQSVRLLRQENSNGRCRLVVYGPEADVATYEFADVTACMKRQAEIEQGLLTAGYHLTQPSSNRRNEHDSWQGPEHRRAAS